MASAGGGRGSAGIAIRFARVAERRALEALQRRATRVWPQYRASLEAHPDAIAIPVAQLRARAVRVAEIDGAVVGFAAVIAGRRAGVVELDGLFVEPERMHAGVGRALVADAMTRARRGGAGLMEVTAGPAEDFYVKVGFVTVRAAQTRFGPAVRMRATLGAGGNSRMLRGEMAKKKTTKGKPAKKTTAKTAKKVAAKKPAVAVKKTAAKKTAAKKTAAKKTVAKKQAAKAPAKKGATKKTAKKSVAKVAKKTAAKKTAAKAPAKKAAVRRRDATGHLDPSYAATLRAKSREGEVTDTDEAFVGRAGHSKDELAEEMGEAFVGTATSGEDENEEVFNQEVPEESGGPFVQSTAGQEFAEGTDESNPETAEREPFPKT